MNQSEAENHNHDNAQNSGATSTFNLNMKNDNGLSHGLAMSSSSEPNSLDKVRDILFGNQVRDIDTRFSRLEERLIKECTSLRDETRSRLDSLENYIKQEVESLANQIKNEHGDRDRTIKLLRDETLTIKSTLEEQISQVDEYANRSQRELREQLFNQSKSLQDALAQKYEEMIALLEREAKDLRHQKTDRSTLATLLNEMAIRLNQ